MRRGVTDAGRQTNKRTNIEDRATQPMDAGGWVSQYTSTDKFGCGNNCINLIFSSENLIKFLKKL